MAESFVFIGNSQACVPLATKLMQAGYTNAESLEGADVVFVYCVGQTLHEDLFFEEQGILAQVDEGKLIIDFSPSTPNLAKEIFAMASLSGVDYVEAPLSLIDIASETGYMDAQNVIARIAGESKPVEAAQAMLQELAAQQINCGEAGQAQLAKCAESLMRSAQVASAIEACALLKAAAAADGTVCPCLTEERFGMGGEGMSAFGKVVCGGEYRTDNGYTLETFLAEIAAAQLAAEDLSLILPHAQSVQYVAELLASAGGAGLSPAAMGLAYGDSEAGKEFGVDWTRLEGGAHNHDHDCDDEDCECGCGGHDHDCACGGHGHDHTHASEEDDDEDSWMYADDDEFRLDFDGVDAFDAESYGENPYPADQKNPYAGYENDWASN